MTATVRTIEPTQITTREAVEWTKCYPDYPATLWTLNYYFRGSGPGFSVTATADGDDYEISVTAANTLAMVPGFYRWQAWLTEIADSTNKKLIGEGRVRVVLGFNPDNDDAMETRTENEIALDSINAALLAFTSDDVLEYEITTPTGSRRVKKSDKTQLLEMRKTFATLVANERARERSRNGGPVMQSIHIRMRG